MFLSCVNVAGASDVQPKADKVLAAHILHELRAEIPSTDRLVIVNDCQTDA